MDGNRRWKVASVMGRYYAMDRDKEMGDRVGTAQSTYKGGKAALKFCIQASYDDGRQMNL